MASESIPRDPCRCKPPPGEEPSPVATGDAGTPACAGGDAPKPDVAFPAQEFCRNGRFPPPDEGDVPKPKSRRGGAGASSARGAADAGENGEGDALEWLEGGKGGGVG